MIHRYPRVLTTMEEDFRAIGLIPENELHEVDTPQNPRDIPSPDPSTLGPEVDDSGKEVTRRSRHSTGMQPRPKIAPSQKDDHDDAMDAGGAQKKGKNAGSYNSRPNYREEREYEEAYEGNPKASVDDGYKTLDKRPGVNPTGKGVHYDGGKDPDRAEGLSSTDTHAGMRRTSGKKAESSSMNRAAELVQEVEDLISGSAMDEELDELRRGFALVGENAILLGDRLLSLAESYEVDGLYEALQGLAEQAAEALDIIEMKVSFEKDKAKSIKNGQFHYEDDEDDDIAVEDIQEAFRAATLQLMDAVELYDGTLTEMVNEARRDDDADDSDADDSDDDDDDSDDDDSDDDMKESVSARLASLREHRARFGRGPT